MNIVGSNYISVLDIVVTFDISGTLPIIYLENQSQGNNLSGVEYAFIVKSPSNTYILEGNINTPNVTGIWSEYTISNPWPRPFNQIEWSGSPYIFQAIVKDADGNVFTGPEQAAYICRPNGNVPTSKNTFGIGNVQVQVKCEQARIFFQDNTNSSYRGEAGTIGSSVLRVNFPMDETGVVPEPFIGGNFSTALVPVTYSGKGYQFLYTSIYEYEFEDSVKIRIKYLLSDTFGVWCNIDLMPLICEYQKLIDSIESGNCSNAEEANRKLMLINPKFSMVIAGMMQPLLGIDVPALIEEIILIGGFNCDCCNAATGIVQNTSSAIDGYNFSVVPLGGDVTGEFVVNGYNIQLELSDVKYVFKICDGSPAQSNAFTVIPSTSLDGFTKTYCLNINVDTLAEEILTAISTNAGLVNLFNSIVTSNDNGEFNLIVDGECIFDSSASCDYTFTLTSIPVNTTFAILSSISTINNTYSPNYSFNLTNLPALQTYLNGLGIGTFAVTNPTGQTVLITSTSNTNNIIQFLYKNPTVNVAAMTKNCTGYVPLTANQVVQNIISYICSLDDAKVVTSQAYEICYIDPSTQALEIEAVEAGVPLAEFINQLLSRGCQTINYITSLAAVNCTSIKNQFSTPLPFAMQVNDYFLGTKNGNCAPIPPLEAFLTMLTYGANNASVLSAFCNLVNLCSGGNPCAPYDVFYAEMDGSPAEDLVITFSHPAAVSNTIRYARIDNTNSPVYITIPGVLPGDSPYTISPVSNGQYRVYIRPVYSDGRLCSESVADTAACVSVSAFSASFDGANINIVYTVPVTATHVRVVINYPNGGSATTIYTNGDTISITPPPSVEGVYSLTMQAVCDLSTGFYGTATSPALVNVLYNQNVLIENIDPHGSGGNTITNVTGITGFTLSGTIVEGGSDSGIHTGFTGPISVTVRQLFAISPTYNGVLLSVNGIAVECINTPGASIFGTTVTFSSRTYSESDVIQITYDYNVCDLSPSTGGTFIFRNDGPSGAIQLDNVSSAVYTIDFGGFPINVGEIATGTHSGFTEAFAVDITNVSTPCSVVLYKNEIAHQCLDVTVDDTYTFSSITVGATDSFEIAIEATAC